MISSSSSSSWLGPLQAWLPESLLPARRPTVGLASLARVARTGDIILFKCRMARCVAQRLLTGSEWDHVAVVVIGAYGELCVLESIASGVHAFPFEQRLREYGQEYADYMVWRPLHFERTPERELALARFVDEVDDEAAFSMDVVAMVATARQSASEVEDDMGGAAPAYFCSQLVVAAWKASSLLKKRVQPASFWPGDCGVGGSVENWLADGVRLGPERLVDWRGTQVDEAWLAANQR